jgi:hypothetical protein
LVISVCAVLAHTRGMGRLRDLIKLIEAVGKIGASHGPLH